MHIAGDRDSWRGSLSPWVTIPSVSVRAFAVYAAGEPDETLPSKQAIRDAQQAFRANLGTLAAGAMSFMTDNGQVTLDDEGLFRLQVRCFDGVCSHKGGWPSWCRGYLATLQRLSEYCCWFRTEEHVTEFVTQCLHCMDSKAGKKVPRPLGETVHGTRPSEVVHFDYLCWSKWAVGG